MRVASHLCSLLIYYLGIIRKQILTVGYIFIAQIRRYLSPMWNSKFLPPSPQTAYVFNGHELPTCIPYFALRLPCSSYDFLYIYKQKILFKFQSNLQTLDASHFYIQVVLHSAYQIGIKFFFLFLTTGIKFSKVCVLNKHACVW